MAKIKEIWRNIKGFDGLYKCSNLGRIKSITRIVQRSTSPQKIRGRIISQIDHSEGYRNVTIEYKSKVTLYVHRVIAECFIPNPENKPCINHKNGIRHDNRIENLEWVTYSENANHAYTVLGRRSRKGVKNGERKVRSGKFVSRYSIPV